MSLEEHCLLQCIGKLFLQNKCFVKVMVMLMKFLLFSVYIFFPSRILECSSSSTSMSTEEKDFYCSSFISPLTGLASISPPFQTDKHYVTIPFAFLWHIKKKKSR